MRRSVGGVPTVYGRGTRGKWTAVHTSRADRRLTCVADTVEERRFSQNCATLSG